MFIYRKGKFPVGLCLLACLSQAAAVLSCSLLETFPSDIIQMQTQTPSVRFLVLIKYAFCHGKLPSRVFLHHFL